MSPSDYPPGEKTEVYTCGGCYYLFKKGELKWVGPANDEIPICPNCGRNDKLERAKCECCGKPATHIETDKATMAYEAFCDEHGMR